MPHYTYRAEWSPDAGKYIGLCLEFPMQFAYGATAAEATAAIERDVIAHVAEWYGDESEPPASVSDRRYSGRFMVRTSPMLHGKLMVEATEQRVSLNQWVVQKLCGKPPSLDDPF
ncbi:type II toxin-antitoxin system HicB family antitoxin [Mycolicibacterium sp. Y3]